MSYTFNADGTCTSFTGGTHIRRAVLVDLCLRPLFGLTNNGCLQETCTSAVRWRTCCQVFLDHPVCLSQVW